MRQGETDSHFWMQPLNESWCHRRRKRKDLNLDHSNRDENAMISTQERPLSYTRNPEEGSSWQRLRPKDSMTKALQFFWCFLPSPRMAASAPIIMLVFQKGEQVKGRQGKRAFLRSSTQQLLLPLLLLGRSCHNQNLSC